MSTTVIVNENGCGVVEVATPGPQGPTGPQGPPGPAGSGGGVAVSLSGNTAGTLSQISTGTLFLAGGNNVTLSQVGNSITISANTAAAANLSVSAGSTSGPFGGLTFGNGSNVSFGLNNGTITASVLGQSVQTQASGSIAGIGTTTTTQAGSTLGATLGTNGLSLAVPAWITTAATGAGGIDVSLAGNTSGTLAQVSTGTLVLAGGNNITLSQVGNNVTISGANAGGAQTGISGVQVSNTTYTSGTVSWVNANGISFGSSGANGISASYTVPTQSNQTEGRYAIGNTTGQSSSSTFDARSMSISGAGAVSVGYSGNALVISAAAGAQSVQTVGVYGVGNTTGQSSSSTYDARSLSFQGAGLISVGNSGGTILISGPGTTGLTQLSAGMSTGGNTTGTTGLASAQLVLAGGANITLSGSTNAGSMTLSIIGGAGAGGGGVGFGVSTGGNTAGATGTVTTGNVVLVGAGPISLSQATGAAGSAATITINAPATSSLVGTNGISISNNGSTISVSLISPIVFMSGNTTGQSSSSSYAPQSLVISGAGGASVGWSAGTVIISGGAGGGAGGVDLTLSGNTTGTLALVSTGTLTLAGGNNITLSQVGNAITISGANAGGAQTGISGIVVSNTTYTSGTVTFQNANGISFGSSGANGISASYTVPAQISTVGLYALGNTTQNSSTTLNQSALSFNAVGALTVGYSAGSIQLSSPATSSLVGTNGISISNNGSTISVSLINPSVFLTGNTTGQSSSNTYAPNSLVVSGAGGASVGWSGSTLIVSGGGGGAGGIDVTLGGNTSGALALVSTGTLFLAGGNNVTLSQNGNSVTISGANAGGAQTGISGMQVSNTTYTSGTVSFVNANGMSFGSSGANGISASYTVPTQTAQTGISGLQVSNTTYTSGTVSLVNANGISFGSSGANGISASYTVPTQSAQTGISGIVVSNTTYASGTVSFSNANGISFGSSAGQAITASYTVPSTAGLISRLNVSAGAGTSNALSGITFANSNSVTFGLSTGAGVGTITASFSAPAQISTVGLFAVGNTTQNSSTTVNQSALSFNGLGAMTVGFSNNSIQLSAPGISSISGTGQVSISVNGSTISIGAPNYGTLSYWDNGILNGAAATTALGAGSVVLQAMVLDANLSISALREFISGSFSATNSSYGNTISIQAGIYTLNGSTLSLLASGSQSYGLTNTSNVSAGIYTGIKGITLPLAANMTPGNYWIGLWSNTASSGFNLATFNNLVASEGPLTYNGILGSATSASNQVILGGGLWSTTSAGLPNSIGLSQITGSVGNVAPFVNLYNVSA